MAHGTIELIGDHVELRDTTFAGKSCMVRQYTSERILIAEQAATIRKSIFDKRDDRMLGHLVELNTGEEYRVKLGDLLVQR